MQEKFVINIGRQLGSGGKMIGEAIAKHLDIQFYDKQLLRLAAKQSGLGDEWFERSDERSQQSILSTLINYLRSPFAFGENGGENILSNDELFKIQSDVIRNIATHESCVFVGRCADYVLRDHPCCINIFITADKKDRIQRVMQADNLNEEQAILKMERIDERRASYYNYYGSGTWGAATTYHLCINSSILGIEGTIKYLLEYINLRINP